MTPDTNKKHDVLIFGGSGFIGEALRKRLNKKPCLSTYCSSPFKGGLQFDVSFQRVRDIDYEASSVSHAVILLGNTNPDWCASYPEASDKLNIENIITLINDLYEQDIKPIFLSTEAVFSGSIGNYTENDPPSPILRYGRQKVEVENYLRAKGKPYVIARLAKVYSDSLERDSFLGSWYHQIIESQPNIRCADDLVSCPISLDDTVTAIEQIIHKDVEGIFHLAGPDPLSRYDICQALLSEISRFRPISVEIGRCSIDDFSTVEVRPKDISMNAEKAKMTLSLQFQDLKTVCRNAMGTVFAD